MIYRRNDHIYAVVVHDYGDSEHMYSGCTRQREYIDTVYR